MTVAKLNKHPLNRMLLSLLRKVGLDHDPQHLAGVELVQWTLEQAGSGLEGPWSKDLTLMEETLAVMYGPPNPPAAQDLLLNPDWEQRTLPGRMTAERWNLQGMEPMAAGLSILENLWTHLHRAGLTQSLTAEAGST